MPWKIENGKPVRVSVRQSISEPEVSTGHVLEAEAEAAGLLECPECGREYKTEDWLERHIEDKHPEA